MDLQSAADAVKEKHLSVEEADDSCVSEYIETLTRDADGSCTTVSGDWSAEVKHPNLAVVKEEPHDVCWRFY